MPQNYRGQQKQRKHEKLLQSGSAYGDMRTKCNVGFLVRFWNFKKGH